MCVVGTPAQVARPTDDVTMLSLEDSRSRRKNTPGDQSMRRTLQDLVASIDPNVKIEPDVEDVCASRAIPSNHLTPFVAPLEHSGRVHRLCNKLCVPTC